MSSRNGQQNREISSQFYLRKFFDENTINAELLRKNYIGVPIEKGFLKTEFFKKLSGKENLYPQCLKGLQYLLPQGNVQIINLLSLFLKDIYSNELIVKELNRETINLFVTVLKNVRDVSIFVNLQKRISKDFYLLGTKREEVLVNLT